MSSTRRIGSLATGIRRMSGRQINSSLVAHLERAQRIDAVG